MAQAATTLNGALADAIGTAVTVRDFVGFASTVETNDLVQIGTEYMLVTAGMGTTSWTVTRGYAGSTAASHIDGSTVYRIERGYTDASRIMTMSKAATTEGAFLRDCADQANAWLNAEVGGFYGPSTDTSRTYDVDYPGTVLEVRGGLRSLTALKYRTVEGGTLTTITSTDYVLRPKTWDLIDGMAYTRLELITYPASLWTFWPGKDMVEITSSTFGPATPPNALRRIADTLGWGLYQSRASGSTGIAGTEELGIVVSRALTPNDYATILLYRGVGPSLYAMPAF